MSRQLTNRQVELRQLEESIRKGLEAFHNAGYELKRIRDEELYKVDGFKNWADYCTQRWRRSKSQCNRLIAASEYRVALPDAHGRQASWSARHGKAGRR